MTLPAGSPGMVWPTFAPVADHALLVSFAESISDAVSASVLALDRALATAPPTGLAECVPAMVNLLIDFDPLLTDHATMQRAVERLLQDPTHGPVTGQWREVEVCYDSDFAPDLAAVATATGLSVDEVIRLHLQADYQVRMYGFAPGYAYLSGVPQALQLPRKPAAIRGIASGSVLIAGPQCLVTTLKMPTGWSVIGRSPTRILGGGDGKGNGNGALILFDVGDQLRFKRIDRAQFESRIQAEGDG